MGISLSGLIKSGANFFAGNTVGGFQALAEDYDRNKQEKRMNAYNERMSNTRIQRTVADAKAAGIHPLYALGAGTHSPTFQTGSAPRGAASDNLNSQLTRAQIRRIDSDIALNQARASAIARDAQRANSEQDNIVQPGGVSVNKNKPLKKGTNNEIRDALEGLEVKTPGGNFTIGPHTPINIIEETYGQIVAEVLGVWKAWKDLRAAEKKMMLNYIKNHHPHQRQILEKSKSLNRGAFRP